MLKILKEYFADVGFFFLYFLFFILRVFYSYIKSKIHVLVNLKQFVGFFFSLKYYIGFDDFGLEQLKNTWIFHRIAIVLL